MRGIGPYPFCDVVRWECFVGIMQKEVIYILAHIICIQGAFDESFYLEIWFAALTGLREASTGLYKAESLAEKDGQQQQREDETDFAKLDMITATNFLLWRTMVLVKVINTFSLKERKSKQKKERFEKKS